jgi:hypothetical protein
MHSPTLIRRSPTLTPRLSARTCLSQPPPHRKRLNSQSPSHPWDLSYTPLKVVGPPLGGGASTATPARCAPPSNPPGGRPTRRIARVHLDWRISTQFPSAYPITTSTTSHLTPRSSGRPLPPPHSLPHTHEHATIFALNNQSRLKAISKQLGLWTFFFSPTITHAPSPLDSVCFSLMMDTTIIPPTH